MLGTNYHDEFNSPPPQKHSVTIKTVKFRFQFPSLNVRVYTSSYLFPPQRETQTEVQQGYIHERVESSLKLTEMLPNSILVYVYLVP